MSINNDSDLCLLCNINKPDHKSSHILSKFLTKEMFGDKHKIGYQVSSNTPIEKPNKKIQDSPKENFIFCTKCEKYFSTLEVYSSRIFKNWKSKVDLNELNKNENKTYILLNDVNTTFLRIFVYSLFWRASISRHKSLLQFKINLELENTLKDILNNHRESFSKDSKKNNFKLKLYPYTISTSDSFVDNTNNLIFAHPDTNEIIRLTINQFDFILFNNYEFQKIKLFNDASNCKSDEFKLIVFTNENWLKYIVKPIIENIAEIKFNRNNKS